MTGEEDLDLQKELEEAASQPVAPTGRFRIYLGAAAGVGKTCAMLDEGWRRAQRGAEVVVGFVETHGRAHTSELFRDVEIVPRRQVEYRGAVFEEMDLDAVLGRKPGVALVDELAHTNLPGSGRHEKRWEDVLELLDSGIGVISTVNIQHLESIADAVERIVGVPVRERVPDWVVRRANQIELIDSSPEQLRRRMLHGNIYPPEKVAGALSSFFRTENLVALRELALRFVADETEDELLAFLRTAAPGGIWDTAERILVTVAPTVGTDAVIRRGARIANRAKAELHVLYVDSGDDPPGKGLHSIESLRKLARDVAAEWHEVPARRRPGGDRRRCPRAADHPDRSRLHTAHEAAGDLERLDRAAGDPPGRRLQHRRARHRPPPQRRSWC